MTDAIFLFPGQGSVAPLMGQIEYATNSKFKESFDRLSELFSEDIPQLCWGAKRFELKQNPYYAHIAIFSISYSYFELLVEHGIAPKYLIGHSYGEVVALICAGGISLEDGIKLIKLRGMLFRNNVKLSESEMIAVTGSIESLQHELEEIQQKYEIYASNYNTSNQIVISVRKPDVSGIISECLQRKYKAISLGVGNGCHSPFVKNIAVEIKRISDSLTIINPRYKVLSSSFGFTYETADAIRSNLDAHITSPVYWYRTIHDILNDGHKNFIEVGFGKILKGLLLSIDPKIEVKNASSFLERLS